MRSTLHQAALDYAAAGMPVFPCLPREQGKFVSYKQRKAPISARSFYDATTDTAQIDAWWTEYPTANIGFPPARMGWSVVDVERDGLDHWSAMDFELTYTTQTPDGGAHYFFKGVVPSSVRKICGKEVAIDTRGEGGYVLLPPSTIWSRDNSEYRSYGVINDTDIAPLPEWIAVAFANRTANAPGNVTRSDIDANLARLRARDHLRDCISRSRISIKGRGGDSEGYRIASELREIGVSADDALALMCAEWYPHCIPHDNPEWVRTKIANAYTYAVTPAGAFGLPSLGETFAEVAGSALVADAGPTEVKRSRFYLEDESDMERQEALTWLLPEICTTQSTVMIYGRSGAYKSYIVMDIALAVATGRTSIGQMPTETGDVIYAALEGRREVRGSRRKAWRAARGIEGPMPFFVTRAPMLYFPGEVEEFCEQIEARAVKPKLIVLETVSKMLTGLDPTKDAPKFHAFCERLKDQFSCTVIAVHHAGHNAALGPKDSTVYVDAFDHVIEVSRPCKGFAEITVKKHKNTEIPDVSTVLEATSVLGDLVFDLSDKARIAETMHRDDPLTPSKVGAAIRKLGGTEDSPIAHAVLASEMTPINPHEASEEREKRVAATAKRLKESSTTALQAYATLDGRSLVWFVAPV